MVLKGVKIKAGIIIHFLRWLLAGLIFISVSLPAQVPIIDSLKIIPLNPTVDDTVSLICYTTFTSSYAVLVHQSIEIEEHLIEIEFVIQLGILGAIDRRVDTLELGLLPHGNYEASVFVQVIDPPYIFDEKTIDFFVEGNSGIDETGNGALVSIYPNPFSHEIYISAHEEINGIEIYSLSGHRASEFYNLNSNALSINLSDLPAAVYIMRVITINSVLYSGKILKK
jgi:hypothetical protein